MDVRLPDGTIVRGVPNDISRADLATKLKSNGMQVPSEWFGKNAQQTPEESLTARVVSGAVEPNLALASSAIATPVAGIAGLAATPFVGAERGAQVVKDVQSAFTYEPKGQGGQAAMKVIGYPFEKLGAAAQSVGETVLQKTGSPELATLVHTIVEGIPQILGAKGAGKVGEIPSIKEIVGKEDVPLTKQQRAMQEVRQEGYRVFPTQARPAVINNLLEGWAGSASTGKELSIKNQPITNNKIKRGLGIDPLSDVDYASIDAVINREGQAYNAVREVPLQMKLTDNFLKAADEVGGGGTEASKRFPGQASERWPGQFKLPELQALKTDLMKAEGATPNEIIDLVRRLRKNGSTLLKSKDDPTKAALGEANRKAADALDALMDKNLQDNGYGGLVDRYQQARKTIAQAYDIRASTNDFTGNVDAGHLLKLSEKRPFTDYLRDIAQAASVSKKGMRTPEQVGGHPGLSSLEGSIAAAEMLSGKIPAGSAFLLRPMIAKIISSEAYQKAFVDKKGIPPALAKRLTQLMVLSGLPMFSGTNATQEQSNATQER